MPRDFDDSEPIHAGFCGLLEHSGADGYKYTDGHVFSKWGFVIVHAHDGLYPDSKFSFIWDGKVHRRKLSAFYNITHLDRLAKRFAEEVATQLRF